MQVKKKMQEDITFPERRFGWNLSGKKFTKNFQCYTIPSLSLISSKFSKKKNWLHIVDEETERNNAITVWYM